MKTKTAGVYKGFRGLFSEIKTNYDTVTYNKLVLFCKPFKTY